MGQESRGIVAGVNVRLRYPGEDGDIKKNEDSCCSRWCTRSDKNEEWNEKEAWKPLNQNLTTKSEKNENNATIREHARRCYGRVKKVYINGDIELTDCTEEMKNMLNLKQCSRSRASIKSYVKHGVEKRMNMKYFRPLTGSRGKAGGMNHALEVLDEHLLAMKKPVEAQAQPQAQGVGDATKTTQKVQKGRLFFAVFDCRHMGQQGFWEGVAPQFFKYSIDDDPHTSSNLRLDVDETVKFVQLPQTFAGLELIEDFFDMRNEYGFRMSNTVRSGVGAVTSCGTNAVWSLDLVEADSEEKNDVERASIRRLLNFRFNTETMIEDTASSHEAILDGQKSIYHFDRKVLGARKSSADYLAAVFRWSQGAVQLFCTSYFECPRCCERPTCWNYCRLPCFKKDELGVPNNNNNNKITFCAIYDIIMKAWWPWIFLIIFVAPICFTIAILQKIDVDQSKPLGPLGENDIWCNGFFRSKNCDRDAFAILSLFVNPWFAGYFAWICLVVGFTASNRKFATYIITLENTTYFFNSISAFFWVFLPIYMCITGTIPLKYDPAVLTFGGLWLEIWTWSLLVVIKRWAPPGG